MTFTKETAKVLGSKGGKQCKTNKQERWEKFAIWFMSNGIERLETEMGALEGKEYINTVKDMLEYFKPKLARTEMTGKDGDKLDGVLVYLPGKNDRMETPPETGDSTSK